MGYYHSTYFAYGIHIPIKGAPWAESERADENLPALKDRCPDVGHLSAGDYDRDHFFLVTKCTEVDLGSFEHVTPNTASADQLADWNRQLAIAAEVLGYTNASEPGWFVVPDLS